MFPTRAQIHNFIYNVFLADANNIRICIESCNDGDEWNAGHLIFNALVRHFDLPNEFRANAWEHIFIEHFTHHLNNNRNVTEVILKRRTKSSSWLTIRIMEIGLPDQQ